MGNKTRNTNYDILDKILADSDRAERASGNGRWVADPKHPDGGYVVTKEQFDQLYKSIDDIEKYLRS